MDLSERTDNINRHPWELSRTDCLIKKLFKLNIKGRVLDIGCGDAYFDRKLLETFPDITELYGVDIYLDKEVHEKRGHWIRNADAIEDKKFDFILIMDVLEHNEDDLGFLAGLKDYLKEDGVIFITVPAYQFLFSNHDVVLHHFRRYNHKQLASLVRDAQLKAVDWHYFYASLVPARLLSLKSTKAAGNWQYSENHIITAAVRFVLNIDFAVCSLLSKLHIYIFGLSLYMTVRK